MHFYNLPFPGSVVKGVVVLAVVVLSLSDVIPAVTVAPDVWNLAVAALSVFVVVPVVVLVTVTL